MANFLMATPMATDLTASSSSQIPISMPSISTNANMGSVRTPTMTPEGARFFQQLGFLDPVTSVAVGLNGGGHSFGHVDLQSPNFNTSSIVAHRNSTKTLKCPKCNWHYKYQEALENHLKDKHPDVEITCRFCIHNQVHPKLARGESYSCGYKPFRCAICNYSTTTKGNLSIHMQSDKHLHAMQEVPSTIVPSGRGLSTTDPADNKPFHCLICGNFTTDSTDSLYDHLNIDRSQTNSSDMSAVHGVYQCFLCPYTTNLKANFQLHTRTDKHIQRVHMINHMRENPHFAGTSTSALLCRIAASKSGVQVRCRPCNEALSS
uniref:C2H2-type domain-containing protein n=1 Tax=Panagrellus redivivus TaxID=6233 RepID=A0A7E4VVR3_PANRE